MKKKIIIFGAIASVVIVSAAVGQSLLTSKDISENINITDTTEVKLIDEEKEKFNLALSNGSDAYIKKDYEKAIMYYEEALSYRDSDLVYIRLFNVYNDQNDIEKAQTAIETAIRLNPGYTDYWNIKLNLLFYKKSESFSNLQNIYNEALTKVNPLTKIDLVTNFARIADNMGMYDESIVYWQLAIELNPSNQSAYKEEIESIKAKKS